MLRDSNFRIQYEKDEVTNNHLNSSHLTTKDDLPLNIQNAILGKRNDKNKKSQDLKNIILKNKVKVLTKSFIRKLQMNSVYRRPIEIFNDADEEEIEPLVDTLTKLKRFKKKLTRKEGVSLNSLALIAWAFINIIQITFMVFIISIMLAFPETTDFPILLYFRIGSVTLYVIDMFLNLLTQRYQKGKYLVYVGQIAEYYFNNGFLIDLISILVLPIDLLANSNFTIILSFVAIVKLVNNIKKFEKFQHLFITSTEKEHYYGLIKVFITNFAIGHLLSIFLNLMAGIDESNWRTKFNIENSEWYVKYIWGYYWGTNIMLTVGFGDIVAANYYEAIILVFIQTFSCITLAYNISYVGALIGSIRENEVSKKKKLKTFHRMCKQNEVPSEIEAKVCNFIEESYQIKQQFENESHIQILESLPKSMQRQYRIEANKILFDGLGFLTNLCKKSLLSLAQEINRKICHPQQVLVHKGILSQFIILQKGNFTFECKIRSQLEGKVIQNLNVEEGEKPKILSLNFIKNKVIKYQVKSKSYSIIYSLNRQQFMKAIRNSEIDFQLFCMIRDRDEYIIDESNLYPCTICKKEYHNKFQCSRLHYIPIKQNLIIKYIQNIVKIRQQRNPDFNRVKINMNSMKHYEGIAKDQAVFIRDNFDEDYFKEIENLFKFYSKVQEVRYAISETMCSHENGRVKNIAQKANIEECPTICKLEEMFSRRTKDNHFWDLEIDAAYNFNYYFKKNNPMNLNTIKKKKKIQQLLLAVLI